MKRIIRSADTRMERIWDTRLMISAASDRIPAAMPNSIIYRTR